MPRSPRFQYPGAIYHVTQRGNERRDIFLNDLDRKFFLHLLAYVCKTYNWICHAYFLMTNHFHLVIETTDPTLSKGMHYLDSVYAQRFNTIQDRVGHLFQNRFGAQLIERDPYLIAVIRYTLINPVRARMVDTPDQWEWSSFRATAGLAPPHKALTTDWVLSQFGEVRKKAQRDFIAYVMEGVGEPSPFAETKHGILGSQQFIDYVRDAFTEVTDVLHDVVREERLPGRPSLEDLFFDTRTKKERDDMIHIARTAEYDVRQIAQHLDLHPSSISRILHPKY